MGVRRRAGLLSRHWCVLALLPLFTFLTLQPAAAALRQKFDIPAQSLRSALISLATQADISIGLTDVNLTNRTSRALVESDTVEGALQRLLASTDLTFEMVDDTTWRIFPRPASPVIRPREEVVPLSPPPLEEITITAAKRPIALQATSTSIAAVTGRVFTDYGAQSSRDLTSFVAGLDSTNQGPGRNKYVIRGLSDGPFVGNTQSTVGVYIDETRAIYNAPDPNLQLFDVDRVEVLRGPQGTLYGAGSIAGLVRIITRQPTLGKFEAHAMLDGNVGAATDPSRTIEGMVNIPVLEDRLALRTVAYTRHSGGYIDDPLLGKNRVNSADIKGVRSTARLRLSPDWTVSTGLVFQGTRAHDTQYFNAAMAPYSRRNRISEPSKNDFLDVNLTVTGDLGWADLVSTTAWLSQHVSSRFDASLALPSLLLMPIAPTAFDQASRYHTLNHETRLVSSSPGALQWIAGVFVSHRTDTSNTTLKLTTPTPPNVFYVKNRRDSGLELAAFGELKYKLSPRWAIDAGVRIYRGTVDVAANNLELIDDGPPDALGHNSKFGFTPKAGISFQVDPDHLIYVAAAQGFRLGGVNIASRINGVSPPGRRPITVTNFDSDRLWNFELGTKSAFFDQRLILNATVFLAAWKDMQADLVRINGLSFSTNLGDADIRGFELESTFAPNNHWLFLANMGWSDVKPKNNDMPLPASVTGRLPARPKLTGALAAQYHTVFFNDYTGFVNLKYDFTGQARLAVGSLPMSEVHAYHTISLRTGIEREQWRVSAYVNNLTDNRTNTYAFGNPFSLGRISQVIPLRPRTFGVNITWTH
jgi:outer membrane receptor protein involved in Fe transport